MFLPIMPAMARKISGRGPSGLMVSVEIIELAVSAA
jgi:hypothetical protein